MGCYDRGTGTEPNSACWAPLWSSSSWQAYPWPTTFTGHVRNLGWLTGLDVWLLYNFEATLKYVLNLPNNFTRRLDGKLMSLASNWVFLGPRMDFRSALSPLSRGWSPWQVWLGTIGSVLFISFLVLMPWRFHVKTQDHSFSFNCIMSVFLTVSSSTIPNHVKPLLTNLNQL